ncbi:hypothetical protein HLB23_08575 [Nocardia uniformis]|uniref:UsfY protein n=1 Tax=Nocardia uniformis TaxID=53432 RepID=A0A849C249_9NOCA|nr:hypothetical protein [Nocardia uniformis]NNH69917.1 hypothetical protein [Nocardia uniformis]
MTAIKANGEHWHPHPGDAIEDHGELPALILCGLGIAALGMTITAAAYGFRGWAVLGAIVTVVLFVSGLLLIRFEYFREFKKEQQVGRHGHNPLVSGEWRPGLASSWQRRRRVSSHKRRIAPDRSPGAR